METQAPQLKYCLYARKSSESDERQAMSIDSQLAEMRALAVNEGLNVVCELQESHSAKDSGKRPVYNKLLKGLANEEYNAVQTWAPNRLSRNAGDLGSVVDLMDQGKLLHIRTFSQTFTNNPNEKFLLMILCSQAKLENDNKSINVKRGINKGVWGSKTFAFRGLLKCGQCGADITAQDKFKTLKKTGEVKRFVYYNCTRRKDPNCTEKNINEDNLRVLLKYFIKENHTAIKISDKLRAKVDKHAHTTKTLLSHYNIDQELDDPFVEYTRYVLTNGTENERIYLVKEIKTTLQIKYGLLEFATI